MVKTIPLAVTICNVHITNSLQQSCNSKSKLISPQHNKFKILDGSHQFSRILPKLALLFLLRPVISEIDCSTDEILSDHFPSSRWEAVLLFFFCQTMCFSKQKSVISGPANQRAGPKTKAKRNAYLSTQLMLF